MIVGVCGRVAGEGAVVDAVAHVGALPDVEHEDVAVVAEEGVEA